jgi:hypothetical protein
MWYGVSVLLSIVECSSLCLSLYSACRIGLQDDQLERVVKQCMGNVSLCDECYP